MRNTAYHKLQLVFIAVKDWEDFLKLGGGFPQKASRKITDTDPLASAISQRR